MHHIFLSYSRTDVWIMRSLYAYLRAEGLEVWADEKLEPGTPDWQSAIENAIKQAACLIVILSPDSAVSKWVRKEIGYARQQEKLIFPILARGEEKTAIPMELVDSQWIDIRAEKHRDYESQMQKLISTIRKLPEVTANRKVVYVPGEDGVRWDRTGSIFWFASDARRLRAILRDGEGTASELKKWLERCHHHAIRLNADKYVQLKRILTETENYSDEDWTVTERNKYVDWLKKGFDVIGRLAENNDPDFTLPPGM